MAEQMRPESKQKAPDPSHNYERSHPSREGGMNSPVGQATPTDAPDRSGTTVANDPARQINAEDSTQKREHSVTPSPAGSPAAAPQQPDHSMFEEEPTGWDQAPQNIKDPQQKRHPRTEGKGGTP